MHVLLMEASRWAEKMENDKYKSISISPDFQISSHSIMDQHSDE